MDIEWISDWLLYEDIIWLDISMDNTHLTEIVQSHDELVSNLSNHLLTDVPFASHHVVSQGASFHMFHHDVNMFFIFNYVVALHYVLVAAAH